jgi:hypothetical protein
MTGRCAFTDAMANDVSDEEESLGRICKTVRYKRKISECDDSL